MMIATAIEQRSTTTAQLLLLPCRGVDEDDTAHVIIIWH